MKARKCVFTLLITLLAFHCGLGQQKFKDNNCQISHQLRFEKHGILYLLLDEQYFKPQELKSLFLCLSQKRLNLEFLKIIALSDEAQLDMAIKSYMKDLTTPNFIFPKVLKTSPPPNYYRAIYYRYKNEYFEYSPNPREWAMARVVLKTGELKKRRR